jgi:hypothetical protein
METAPISASHGRILAFGANEVDDLPARSTPVSGVGFAAGQV